MSNQNVDDKDEKKSRKSIDLKQKIEIIKSLERGVSVRETARMFKVSRGSVQYAKEHKNEITSELESGRSLKKSRITRQSDINRILYRWFVLARAYGYPVGGSILQEKAREIARDIGMPAGDFVASDGWLDKWKSRNCIRHYRISGEAGIANKLVAREWMDGLSEIIWKYKQEDVFNLDETGYFFRSLPDTTLSRIGERCNGGKLAKDRITAVFTCSAGGEKLPAVYIGKSKNPRCFRGVNLKEKNIEYYSSPKAWMTNNIFNTYLKKLNLYFSNKKRHIILFLDNAPVHIVDEENTLTNIKLVFFPPNLTSLVQPLDAGIIRSVKVLTRKFQILSLLEKIGANEHASVLAGRLSILDAIIYMNKAWELVKDITITRCFYRCGFFNDTNDVIMDNQMEIEYTELAEVSAKIGIQEEELTVEELIPEFEAIDEENIVNNLIDEFYEDDDEEMEDSEENLPVVPIQEIATTIVDNHTAREMISSLIMYVKANGFIEEEPNLLLLYGKIEKRMRANSKQTTIDSYLIKK